MMHTVALYTVDSCLLRINPFVSFIPAPEVTAASGEFSRVHAFLQVGVCGCKHCASPLSFSVFFFRRVTTWGEYFSRYFLGFRLAGSPRVGSRPAEAQVR